ncbi:MAG: ATP-binding protein [Bacilli bacterium]|nr:ATP-binding protein [Bacilli bacterium]MDD7375177.1 ATP-binding protein [Bacilli bacterium]MDD7549626.1 ATP-binding protein [Bacilli bacterium]MDY4156384.1 ATP-binding protein [Bacilli bacterium]MDY5248594.1 ATP-binding protein [Bacilli bacterium]
MNKRQFTFNSLIGYFIVFLVYVISLLSLYIVTFNDYKKTINKQCDKIYEYFVNEGDEEKIIKIYSSFENLRISFIDDKVITYDSYNIFNDASNIEENKVFSYTNTSLNSTYYYCAKHVSGTQIYIRVGIQLTTPVILSYNFLIYGSITFLTIMIIFIFYVNHMYDDAFKPIKIQVKKLQKIVNKKKTISYDDDLKNLALIVRDSRKELEEQFKITKQSEQKIEFILDSFSEALVVIDSDYKIIMFNKKASEIFEIKKEEAYNKSFDAMVKAKHIEGNMSMVVQTNRAFSYVEKIEGKVYECLINPIDYEWSSINEKAGASLLMIDITDEYNSSEMKKQFFANASHELKTPLTSIIGYLEMMKVGILSSKEEIDNAIDKSINDASRMKKIIFDMLELSSLENETLRPITLINIKGTLKEIITSLEVETEKRGLKILFANDDDFDIRMNKDDFERLFKNLIENAIIYNKPNGCITINIDRNKRSVSIKDEGIGIKEEDISRIFERFYRVDKARSRRESGTGLGLAIVKHICEYYDYKITVQSTINIGSIFTIKF